MYAVIRMLKCRPGENEMRKVEGANCQRDGAG